MIVWKHKDYALGNIIETCHTALCSCSSAIVKQVNDCVNMNIQVAAYKHPIRRGT